MTHEYPSHVCSNEEHELIKNNLGRWYTECTAKKLLLMDDGEGGRLELRHHACGSTLAREFRPMRAEE